jgi:membrane fusion protein (multidrug efflux system)
MATTEVLSARKKAHDNDSVGHALDFDPPSSIDAGRIWLVFALVALVATIALFWGYEQLYWEATDDAQIDGHVDLISSRVAGMLDEVHVENNSTVQTGEVLARIAPEDYVFSYNVASAAVEAATAQLARTRAQAQVIEGTVRSDLLSAQASVQEANMQLKSARSALDAASATLVQARSQLAEATISDSRQQQMFAFGIVSKASLDQADAQLRTSKAEVDRAQAALESAKDEVSSQEKHIDELNAALIKAQTGPQQVAAARGEVATAGANLHLASTNESTAELNLRRTLVIAPADGVIAMRTAELGESVQAGQPLMAIVETHSLWVTANFKETQIKRIKPGEVASVYLDANGREYRGQVESIAGGTGSIFAALPPEDATGNWVKVVQRVPVRILLDHTGGDWGALRPGLSVRVRVRVR